MKLKNFFKKMALTLLDHKPTAAPEMPIGGASAKHSRAIQTAERKSKFTEILAKLEAQHKKRVAVRNEKSVHRMERIYRRTRFDSMLPENASDQGEHIPVVFICDDHYAFPTGVAILSLLRNKKHTTRYEIFVLGRTLSKESRQLLESFGSIVHVLHCDDVKIEQYANTHQYVSSAALLKFDIPQLLPDRDKVLYLDSDVLVLGDLSELFATPIEDCYAAVVKDLLGTHYTFHTRTGVSSYFNSGVLLLNTKRMRDEGISAKLLENKSNHPWKMLMDQDAFNVTFSERVIWLHPRYNMMYGNNLNSGWSVAQMAAFYGITPQEMKRALWHPLIQHLSSAIKPWDSPLAAKYLDYQRYRILYETFLKERKLQPE